MTQPSPGMIPITRAMQNAAGSGTASLTRRDGTSISPGMRRSSSIQPKIDEMNLSVDELSEYFADADIRSGEYVKDSVALGKVRALMGSTPIEQINPLHPA